MAETNTTVGTVEHTPSGEHGGGFPPFKSETFPSQLFWLALTFIIFYVLMSKLALPRISSILEEREKHIEGDIAAADRLKKQSDEAIAAYEKALADARAKAQAIAAETRSKQTAELEAARKKLEDQLSKRLAEAEKTIAATKEAAMSNVRGIAVDTAKAIVEQLIGKSPADAEVASAVADALKR
ncbi:MAG TPA: F0F1 ATP synthase subunit B [Pseudolabrys sp.]|jgi:F-type H+-transporting ATPase subunit b|nr:F0F1 ATP synthase subunit B [Pseudolabrys sp.]